MYLQWHLLLFALNVLNPPNQCPIINNNRYEIPRSTSNEYDFVIVGGGTAGCVLANRLSEDPNVEVLLIEHGDLPTNLSEIPLNFLYAQRSPEDWSFRVTQDGFFKGMKDNVNLWPQGHALGGSSTINAMLYIPGFPHDYDVWGDLVDPDWSWTAVQPYFQKLHQYVKTTPYKVEVAGRTFLEEATLDLGYTVNDPNSMYGFKDVPLTVVNHTRFSMAKAYLQPILGRPNLKIMLKTQVNKVLINDGKAYGVKVQKLGHNCNKTKKIYARKEVIVTAGAINSPKILMLSGIGPRDHQAARNIPLVADLPVGQNLMDHTIVPFYGPITDIDMVDLDILLQLYCQHGVQLDNANLANFPGFFNTEDDPINPDIEIIPFELLRNDQYFFDVFLKDINLKDEFAQQLRDINQDSALLLQLVTVSHPKSKGHVQLQSRNPSDPPLVDAGYFTDSADTDIIIKSIDKFIEPLMRGSNGSDIIRFDIPECDNFEYKSRDYWVCYMEYFAMTVYHPSGTCRMGKDPSNSVVDSRLRVWGVENLRVADSSTIVELIAGHTNIPTAMIAEKAADYIKQANGMITS